MQITENSSGQERWNINEVPNKHVPGFLTLLTPPSTLTGRDGKSDLAECHLPSQTLFPQMSWSES